MIKYFLFKIFKTFKTKIITLIRKVESDVSENEEPNFIAEKDRKYFTLKEKCHEVVKNNPFVPDEKFQKDLVNANNLVRHHSSHFRMERLVKDAAEYMNLK